MPLPDVVLVPVKFDGVPNWSLPEFQQVTAIVLVFSKFRVSKRKACKASNKHKQKVIIICNLLEVQKKVPFSMFSASLLRVAISLSVCPWGRAIGGTVS